MEKILVFKIHHKNNKIQLKHKIDVLKKCIIQTLIFGTQTWSIREQIKTRLETSQRAMIRIILGLRRIDKIKIKDMYRKTKMENINYILED